MTAMANPLPTIPGVPEMDAAVVAHQEKTLVSFAGRQKCSREPAVMVCAAVDDSRQAARRRFDRAYEHWRQLPGGLIPKPLHQSLSAQGLPPYIDGPCLIVMFAPLPGQTLTQWLKTHHADLSTSLALTAQIASALQKLHNIGLIHGRLNPDHIIYRSSQNTIGLTGFGPFDPTRHPLENTLWENADDSANALCNARQPDLAYAAPEATGRLDVAVDRRSDLYSLGTIMFELLWGRPPFVSADRAKLIHAHIVIQLRFFLAAYLLINAKFWKQVI